MLRTHALVIVSVRPWLEMQGLSLRVGGSGLLTWVSCRIKVSVKLGKFHVCSGDVHDSDCCSAHCSGCVVNAWHFC